MITRFNIDGNNVTHVSVCSNTNMDDISEYELAYLHKEAIKVENYKICNMIKKEISRRIKNNEINHNSMQRLKKYNPETERYEGKPNLDGLNGLFDGYEWDKFN